jgi:hypothetical protein
MLPLAAFLISGGVAKRSLSLSKPEIKNVKPHQRLHFVWTKFLAFGITAGNPKI